MDKIYLTGRLRLAFGFGYLAGTLSFLAFPTDAAGQTAKSRPAETFRVVGYLPDYRIASFEPDQAKYLTDLVYFAANPSATGELHTGRIKADTIKLLKDTKQQYKVRLHLCIGGGSRSKGFPALAASAAARKRLVDEATAFCLANSFDGVDVDWEHPESPKELQDHALLLTALKKRFQPHRLRLTVAMAGWQKVLPDTIQAVDGIHLMSYDAKGRHSTYEAAEKNVKRMVEKGVPVNKLYLGLPFYGRGVDRHEKTATYAEIVQKYRPAANVDEVDGIYFNGIWTIERKTKFALAAKLGGVMVWEVGQDSNDGSALLPVIRQTVDKSRRIGK